MKTVVASVLILSSAIAGSASAHGWYDGWCCSEKDCTPASRVDEQSDGSVIIWSGGKPTAVPKGYPYRPSLDANWHICIANGRVRCVYMPAGS